MDAHIVEGLLARLSLLHEHGQALLEQASGFPALECNCKRAMASLKMMEISLGLSSVPLPARHNQES